MKGFMNRRFMQELLDSGEGFTIEYKKNKSELSLDIFKTISSFSNRYGGHVLLGVTEVDKDGRKVGQVNGVDKDRVYDMKRDFINILNNPSKFKPTIYLELEEFDYEGKTILWTYVPPMSQLCYCDKKIYDRNGDADQDITDKNDRIAEIISRKSADYLERQILPYATEYHLKMELMNKVRQLVMARDRDHPWATMDNMGIMRSAGLYVENIITGKSGFNMAAILLFGKKEVIKSCVPGYKTDAIYRAGAVDRYDDRDIIEDNLIESYDKLMTFCKKHMNNRFVLDEDISIDARELIAREVVSNILIHRDYSSAYPAKLIIEKNVLRTENWSKSRFNGPLNIESFSPYPKNPIISSFFVNIGRADTLGSGMRNLYKYTRLYSNADPILTEGDIFEIKIPLIEVNTDSKIETDVEIVEKSNNLQDKEIKSINRMMSIYDKKLSDSEKKKLLPIIEFLQKNAEISKQDIIDITRKAESTAKRYISILLDKNIIVKDGDSVATVYRRK